jgi:hypothetical protein
MDILIAYPWSLSAGLILGYPKGYSVGYPLDLSVVLILGTYPYVQDKSG